MAAQKNLYNKLAKRLPGKERFRFFLLFVLISLLFWMSTKFSKTYQVQQTFVVHCKELPKDVVLLEEPHQIALTIRASGFELLLYRLFYDTLELSMRNAIYERDELLINSSSQLFAIQQQLFSTTQLLGFDTSEWRLDYSRLAQKKVAVRVQSKIRYRAGYLPEDRWSIAPDSIILVGSTNILDTIYQVNTQPLVLNNQAAPISAVLPLDIDARLSANPSTVNVAVNVLPYSEKKLEVLINIINLPNDIKLKLFPAQAEVRVILPLQMIPQLQPTDIEIAVDYSQLKTTDVKSLPLKVIRYPDYIKTISISPKTVDYLIRK